MKLKKDDVVRLKSSQNKKEMTVLYAERDVCWCYYRVKSGDFKVVKIEGNALEKIKGGK